MTTTPPDPSPACPSCGSALTPAARFCHRCGAAMGVTPLPARGLNPWIPAGVIIAVALMAIVWVMVRPATRSGSGPMPTAAGPGAFGGQAPDISQMTPRESFDRLYGRVMDAVSRNDTAAIVRFTDHAISAYTRVPDMDDDGRFHAATLLIQIGQYAPALAIADTILAAAPDHLLGWLIRGTVAELRGDTAGLADARRGFLAGWADDIYTRRAEYLDHQAALDAFHRAAVPR